MHLDPHTLILVLRYSLDLLLGSLVGVRYWAGEGVLCISPLKLLRFDRMFAICIADCGFGVGSSILRAP